MKRYFWANKEIAIVAEYYQAGGVKACLPHLPRRTAGAIRQQAHHLGLMFGAPRPRRPRKIWATSPEADRMIVDCYQQNQEKSAVKKLARRLSRPYWWVKKRASVLGVARPVMAGNKELEWSMAELDLLRKHSHKGPDVIARKFREHGFMRTATAISVKRKRLALCTVDHDHFTASQLAAEFGVDVKTITRWIDRGWLKATRRGTCRTAQQGGDMWWIKRLHVKKFVVESVGVIDIRKVNKVWFVDLLAG